MVQAGTLHQVCGLARGTPFAAVSSNVRTAPDRQQHGPGLVASMGGGSKPTRDKAWNREEIHKKECFYFT